MNPFTRGSKGMTNEEVEVRKRGYGGTVKESLRIRLVRINFNVKEE